MVSRSLEHRASTGSEKGSQQAALSQILGRLIPRFGHTHLYMCYIFYIGKFHLTIHVLREGCNIMYLGQVWTCPKKKTVKKPIILKEQHFRSSNIMYLRQIWTCQKKTKTVKKLIKDFEEQHFRSSKTLKHIETSLPSSIRKLISTKP